MRQPQLRLRVARALVRHGRRPVWTVRRGPAAGLRLGVEGASADYWSGRNERPVQRALVESLQPGDTVYDVGANIGFFSLLAARLVGPTGRVVACEPVALNATCLRNNVARNDPLKVEVLELALAEAPGRGALALAHHPGGAGLAAHGRPVDFVAEIDVEVETLDRLVFARGYPVPTLVKVDVEGAEAAVLSGMADTIAAHHPVLIVECDAADAAGLEARVDELSSWLVAAGYRVDRLEACYPARRWHVAHLRALA